jgi:hypothetical protein
MRSPPWPVEARSWMLARFSILVHSRRLESLNHYTQHDPTMRVAGLAFI